MSDTRNPLRAILATLSEHYHEGADSISFHCLASEWPDPATTLFDLVILAEEVIKDADRRVAAAHPAAHPVVTKAEAVAFDNLERKAAGALCGNDTDGDGDCNRCIRNGGCVMYNLGILTKPLGMVLKGGMR